MVNKILFLGKSEISSMNPDAMEIIEAIEAGFRDKALGFTQFPLKPTIHPRPESFLRALTGYISGSDVAGLKWVSAYPSNRKRGLPLVNGLVVLNDPDTGLPRAVLEASWITAWRTAAVSAISVKHLALETAETLAICGAGVQGTAHLKFLSTVIPHLCRVKIYDPNPVVLKTCLEDHRFLDPKIFLEGVTSPREAVEHAQVVVTAAPMMTKPLAVIESEWLAPGVLCLPLDFDSYFAPSVFKRCDRFFSDDTEQLLWFKTENRFSHMPRLDGELSQLLTAQVTGREHDEQRIMFIGVGIALGDLVAANLLVQKATRLGSGIWIDF